MRVAIKSNRHLSDIANISLGRQLNRSTLSNTGSYPVYNGGMTASGYTDKFNTDANQIIISQGGESAGFVNYIAAPFWAGAHCYVVQPTTDEVDKRYLYFYLKSMQRYLQESRTGSSIPGLSKSKLSQFPVQVPSIDEQKTASDILTNIENAISLNNDLLEICNKVTELLYDYWFIQFDFPSENGRPYKSSGGKMVYNDQLKQEVPEGWEVKGLMTIADWTSGAQPPKSQHIDHPSNGYVHFIQNRDYSDDKNVRYIPESKANKLCNEYDIMVDKYGDAGRTRFGLKGAFNVALAKITPTIPNTQEYLRCYLSQQSIYRHLHESCMMSTRASLNAASLAQLSIVVPPQAILQKFENLGKKCIELVLVSKEQSKRLASLRDWLLPMLMNGQVEIKERKEV